MKKLKDIKLANAVRCGSTVNAHYKAPDYCIELVDTVLVKITNHKGESRYTSLYNAVDFEFLPETDEKPKARGRLNLTERD